MFGIRRLLNNIRIKYNVFLFSAYKNFWGFEKANCMFRYIDKACAIPILKLNGATIGRECDIETPLYFHNCKDYSNLIIGNNCHIGKCCFFDLRDKIKINDNAVISMQSTIITHIDMGKSELSKIYKSVSLPVEINKNCYIGAGSLILSGISVGENTMIGAGSVVIKNTETNSLYAGVPAKFIKSIDKSA